VPLQAINEPDPWYVFRSLFLFVLSDVTAWFWGHEHDLIVYGEHAGLRRGRCIGHGAVPVGARLSDVFGGARTKRFDVPINTDVQLGREGLYYAHGYVILQLDGPSAHAVYYQQGDPDNSLFEEDLASIPRVP
jgi:hypothetical protein